MAGDLGPCGRWVRAGGWSRGEFTCSFHTLIYGKPNHGARWYILGPVASGTGTPRGYRMALLRSQAAAGEETPARGLPCPTSPWTEGGELSETQVERREEHGGSLKACSAGRQETVFILPRTS